jgi:RNA polymerase sigma factor (sigma-70 family)
VLNAALAELPRRQREVVVLRYVGDFSEAQVASALGISPGAVKQHASRGLAALRNQLEDN